MALRITAANGDKQGDDDERLIEFLGTHECLLRCGNVESTRFLNK